MKIHHLSMLLSVIFLMVSCETTTLLPWEETIDTLPADECRITTSDLGSSNEASQAVEDMISGITSAYSEMIYTVTNSNTFQYNNDYNQYADDDRWGAHVDYDCDGAEIFVYISKPYPIAQATQAEQDVTNQLEESGYQVLALDSDLITTSEGDYMVFSLYYTYSGTDYDDEIAYMTGAGTGTKSKQMISNLRAIPSALVPAEYTRFVKAASGIQSSVRSIVGKSLQSVAK
ncbi:MAG: hypothetical protein HOE90_21555 [Bacteriovoracaceae bacterium]|jgi:hypothetical protein|nr:hypothetical protein [Bacteriovoracaceae bacterium]